MFETPEEAIVAYASKNWDDDLTACENFVVMEPVTIYAYSRKVISVDTGWGHTLEKLTDELNVEYGDFTGSYQFWCEETRRQLIAELDDFFCKGNK